MAGDPTGHEQAAAPAMVLDLVERFAQERNALQADAASASGPPGPSGPSGLWPAFLAPLFAALGWDMDARAPAAAPVPIGARIDGRRALFIAVLDPAKRLSRAADAIRALRRHGWSAGVPLVVATSFAELAVYDCGRKPAPGDRAGTGRVLYLTCADYAARWPDIAALLSREAVARALAEAPRKRRGAVSVVTSLLADMDAWRCTLAQDLARRHPAGAPDQPVAHIVQRTLERILFLRMCEERGIEPAGQLRRLAGQPGVPAAVARLHRDACARHGTAASGPDPDDAPDPDHGTCDPWRLDDGILRAIIERLYLPDCPYVFSVLPAEALGHVYEHFLGRRVHTTAGGRAAVDEQRETRKAGGVYYTPPHIVAYVVRHTVGAWLAGKTPRQARRIRILDPACGAGSFLLGAYQYLLHWHQQAHEQAGGTGRLGTRERLRILGESLYGVDIDPQAVQVTRQALLLEALAGAPDPDRASDRGGQRRARTAARPAAPALGTNIRCGNALVAPDFLAAHDLDLDPDQAARVRAFDWAGAFPRVLGRARPGFDVVLGNPPWGQKDIVESDAVKRWLRHRFQSLGGHYDLFRPFVEQGIRLLARGAGRFGMVLPDIVLLKDYQETRRYLLDQLTLTHIDWWGMAFPAAVIDAATIVGTRRRPPRAHAVHVAMREPGRIRAHTIPQADFRANDRHVFNLSLTPARRAIIERLARFPRLGDWFEVHEGVHSGNIRQDLFVARAVDDSCAPLLLGRAEIAPYDLRWAGRFIRLSALPARRGDPRYANIGQPAWFHGAKVLVRRTGDRVLAAVDRQGRYASNNFFVVLPRAPGALGLDGLCALLNSRLMTWYFRTIEPRKGRAFAELKIKHLTVFPLPDVQARPDACAALERLGAERARLAAAPDTAPGNDARALDQAIDRTVHALFALTADEVAFIDDLSRQPLAARDPHSSGSL